MSSSLGDCYAAPGWVWVGHLMLNGEPALRRRHSGNTFSATGRSATHGDARTVEFIGVSAATEATGTEATGTEPLVAEATARETYGATTTGFWNDPRSAVRPNPATP